MMMRVPSHPAIALIALLTLAVATASGPGQTLYKQAFEVAPVRLEDSNAPAKETNDPKFQGSPTSFPSNLRVIRHSMLSSLKCEACGVQCNYVLGRVGFHRISGCICTWERRALPSTDAQTDTSERQSIELLFRHDLRRAKGSCATTLECLMANINFAEENGMPKFTIERTIPGAGNLNDDQLRGISQKSCGVLKGMGPQVQWLESFVTDDKVYCVYIGPDEASICEHARLGEFPAHSVQAVRRMIKKSYGKESKLAYPGHALVENRNGLITAAMATQADGHAERDAALLMLDQRQKDSSRRITVGADKACDAKNFIAGTRALNVTAHVQKNEKGRRSNLDRRTTRHAGYAVSLSRRWLIEKTFGWLKQTGPLAQVKLRGLAKVDWLFVFSCAAHNLLRLPKLIGSQDQQDQQDPQQHCA